MSLFKEFQQPCCLMTKTLVADGEGGYSPSWVSSSTSFSASIIRDDSMVAKIADAEGVKENFTITTDKDHVLKFHDVIKRIGDGETFRVTSNGNEKQTPASASFSFSQVTAERWKLT